MDQDEATPVEAQTNDERVERPQEGEANGDEDVEMIFEP